MAAAATLCQMNALKNLGNAIPMGDCSWLFYALYDRASQTAKNLT
jgi:hypothetical protein